MKSILFLVLLLASTVSYSKNLRVGSKTFTESYILGEIISQKLNRDGYKAKHKKGWVAP